jgi:Fe-S oxidoreductase
MAKLKAEFLHFYHQGRPRSPGHLGMGWIHRVYQLGALAAPLTNWLGRQPLFRWFLEHAAGIDRRRSLPELHAHTFRRWFAQRPAPPAGTRGKVLLLDDCFTTYNEPEIGESAVDVLEAAGYQVELAGLVCCGRPMISKGFLPQARDLIQAQAGALARRLHGALAIVGLEPSCLLTLADEWQELVPSPTTRKIAASAQLLDHWLADQVAAGHCELRLKPLRDRCIVHGHCHQKALVGTEGTRSALQLIPQLDVEVLNTGCCGMAGSFGYEKNHYDVSVAIANLDLLPALSAQPDALVVAPGTSCRHQIRDLSERRALHPLEVLAQRL